MKARLFTLFDLVPFPSYFTLLLTGFILATVLAVLWAKRIGHNPDVIVDLVSSGSTPEVSARCAGERI